MSYVSVALDYTRISLVAEKSRFDESDGNISGALFVQLDRPMEPGVSIQLSQILTGEVKPCDTKQL